MLLALIIMACITLALIILLIRIQVSKPDGLLNIDKRDPDKDFWDFVLLIPPETAEKKRHLRIEVIVKN